MEEEIQNQANEGEEKPAEKNKETANEETQEKLIEDVQETVQDQESPQNQESSPQELPIEKPLDYDETTVQKELTDLKAPSRESYSGLKKESKGKVGIVEDDYLRRASDELGSKTSVVKDLYMRPLYDKENLFTTVLDTNTDGDISKSVLLQIDKSKLKNLASLSNIIQDRDDIDIQSVSTVRMKSRKSSCFFTGVNFGNDDVDFHPAQSSTTSTTSDLSTFYAQKQLQYLMKLMPFDEYEEEAVSEPSEEISVEEVVEENGKTEAMRQAQKYLRVHKIFEFFQFLTSHLLSAAPGDPINFLIDLLDKCLIYRAGFSDPPLLYTRKHIECLFNLMDRMRTGFIEMEQYKTGMITLGICSYNETPPLINDLVAKEYFIEEAYDCLTLLLDDMLKRRWLRPINRRTTPLISNTVLDVVSKPNRNPMTRGTVQFEKKPSIV